MVRVHPLALGPDDQLGERTITASDSGDAHFAATATGTITTVAGDGTSGPFGHGGPPTNAELDNPTTEGSAGTQGRRVIDGPRLKAVGELAVLDLQDQVVGGDEPAVVGHHHEGRAGGFLQAAED